MSSELELKTLKIIILKISYLMLNFVHNNRKKNERYNGSDNRNNNN